MLTDVRVTPEQYLEAEELPEVRHEFVDGAMHEMKGESKTHNLLTGRLVRLLDQAAEARGYDVFFTVVKMRVPNNRYRYPDVVVTCEDDADEYMIEAPCAVFEVLSDSTEDVDVGEKLEEYLKIPSVQRYVLLRQDREGRGGVEIFLARGNGIVRCAVHWGNFDARGDLRGHRDSNSLK